MDPVIPFGRVLRRLRKGAGFSQEDLALEAEIETNFVSLIERGVNQPTVRVVFKIAGALGTSPSEIFRQVEKEIKEESAAKK